MKKCKIVTLLMLVLLLAPLIPVSIAPKASAAYELYKKIYPSQDTFISEFTQNTNYGSADFLKFGIENGKRRHTLMRFSLSSLPSDVEITRAYLYMYRYKHSIPSGKSVTIKVYRVVRSWVSSQATWIKRTSSANWYHPGGDYYSGTAYATRTFSSTISQTGWMSFTITNLVRYWYDNPSSNFGLILVPTSGEGAIYARSMNYATSTYRPYLRVYYRYKTSISAPSTITVAQGESKKVVITVSSSSPNTINLQVTNLPSGVAYTLNPNSGTAPFSAELTITAASSASTGTYTIKIKATGTGVYEEKQITLKIVQGGDFSLSFNPPMITVPQGGSGSSTLVASFSGGFTGPITLTVQSKPTGFTVNIATSGSTAIVTVNVATTVSPGTYSVVIKGTGGGKTHTATLTVKVEAAGFSLAFNPTSITVKQGESGSSSLSIASIGGFTGTVTLSVENAPSGLNVEITPSSATPGSSVTVTVTADQSVAPGSYNIIIKGEGGGKSATATLSVTVEEQPFNFNLQASPSSLTIDAGEQATITITATLASGSPQELTLSLSGLPAGASYSFSPPTITPTGSSTLTIDTTGLEGSYSLVITASGGGVARQAVVSLKVKKFDFTIAANPTSVEISQGESTTIAITVTKTSGAAKKVKLSLLGLPSGASYSFSPEELEPTGTSILTINAGSAKGTYTLIVRATADGLERTATVTLKIKEKRCIIATVTYGSEVSREVNFLRGFRDRIVLASYAGQRFYAAFDAFYYSWSPGVAQYILEHPWLKAPIKALLYPLLASLLVSSSIALPVVQLSPEVGVYLAGTISSALIGLFYLAPALFVAVYMAKRKGLRIKLGRRVFRAVLVFPLVILGAALAFQMVGADLAVTAATSAYVLSVIVTSAAASVRLLGGFIFKQSFS